MTTGKDPYEPVTEELDAFFNGETRYQPIAVWTDHPGKRVVTAEDPDGDEIAINWEGGDRFSYDQDGETHELSDDHELYDVAADLVDAYPVVHLDADGTERYGTVTHTNSGGEASRALNRPLEWGIETGYRTWEQRQDEARGPLASLVHHLL